MNYLQSSIFFVVLLTSKATPVFAVNNYEPRLSVIVKKYSDKFPSASRDLSTLNVVSTESCLNTVKILHSNARTKGRIVDADLVTKSGDACKQSAITKDALVMLGRGKSNGDIWVRNICMGVNVGAYIFKSSDMKKNNEKAVNDFVEDWAEEATLTLCPKYLDAVTNVGKK